MIKSTGGASVAGDSPGGQRIIRLLLVDDDLQALAALRNLLSGDRYLVVGEAASGEEAVELSERLLPDAVCLDIGLPGIDGFETARRLQAGRPVPIVMVTAFDDLNMVERAGTVGVGAYVVKPPFRPELERAIAIARARFADWSELRRLNAGLSASLAEVRTVTGLLPICSGCKKIRDDHGYWREVEDYIRSHSQLEFTHGICPECRQQVYPDA